MQSMSQVTQFDEYGLLVNPRQWSPELAQQMAQQEGLGQLTRQHWEFIESLRDYYQEFRVPPPAARICHDLRLDSWCGHDLFHSCLTAWRIAGLPDPGEEAKAYMSAE